MSKTSDKANETSDPPAAEYRVLARKYRPQTFEELIGQDALVRTLTNAFKINRIAQAYMLTGVRGVGKTTTARLIARALNYTLSEGPSVDMTEMGEHCHAILESRHVDVIEMDAASNTGVDNVREIIDSVRYRPSIARYKVYIIDEVHMLSKSAFNALLKTLEEPPPHVKFIFATTEIRKVPVTVLSRCQRFDLLRVGSDILIEHFTKVLNLEQANAEEEALKLIARAAEGSVRDGLSLLDQAIAYAGEKISAEQVRTMLGLVDQTRIVDLFEAVMQGDAATALNELTAQYQQGADPQTVLADVAGFTHLVSKLKVLPDAANDISRIEAERTRGIELAGKLSLPVLARAWQMLSKGLDEVARSPYPLMAAEMVLIRLAHIADLPPPEKLIEAHKKELNAQSPAPATATAALAKPIAPAVRTETAAPLPSQAPQAALAVNQDAPVSPPSREPLAFKDFAAIVQFVDEKRDLKLKHALLRHVRPIKVAPGRLEIALESEADRGLANELGRKLKAWSGQNWMVLIVNTDAGKTLHQLQNDEKASLFRDAACDPDVRAALDLFPGAEIVDVRPLEGPDVDPSLPLEDD